MRETEPTSIPDVMNLKELHKRLGDIIADNEATGRIERNYMPMVAEIFPGPRKYRQRYKSSKFYPIKWVSSAVFKNGNKTFMAMTAHESAEIK